MRFQVTLEFLLLEIEINKEFEKKNTLMNQPEHIRV